MFLVLVRNKSVKLLLVGFKNRYDLYGNKRIKSRTEVFENEDGSQLWYLNGYLHRDNGPATIIFKDDVCNEAWFQHGLQHRENGPAVINRKLFNQHEWWLNGKIHRATIDKNGHVEPAIYNDIGDKYWYKDGQLHRNLSEGPASMKTDAVYEWWIDKVQQPEPHGYYDGIEF